MTKVDRVVDEKVYTGGAEAELVESVGNTAEASLNEEVVLVGGRGSAGSSTGCVVTGSGITETVAVSVTSVVGSEALTELEVEMTADVESETSADVASRETTDVDCERSAEVEFRISDDVNSMTSGAVVGEAISVVMTCDCWIEVRNGGNADPEGKMVVDVVSEASSDGDGSDEGSTGAIDVTSDSLDVSEASSDVELVDVLVVDSGRLASLELVSTGWGITVTVRVTASSTSMTEMVFEMCFVTVAVAVGLSPVSVTVRVIGSGVRMTVRMTVTTPSSSSSLLFPPPLLLPPRSPPLPPLSSLLSLPLPLPLSGSLSSPGSKGTTEYSGFAAASRR